jgi:hypothetical protein
MPIPHGYSRKTFGRIVKQEVKAGYKPKQAVAIAYSVARRAAKKAHKRPAYLRRSNK